MNLEKQSAGRFCVRWMKIFFCLAVLVTVLCAKLPAQEAAHTSGVEPKRLGPEDAVQLAIRNNLSLESSRASLAAKERASKLSWNQFIPNVTLAGSLSADNKKSDPVQQSIPIPNLAVPPTPFSRGEMSGNIYPVAGIFVTDPISVSQWHIAGSIQTSLNINYAMFENMKRLRLDYESGILSYEKAKAQLERDVRKLYHNMLLMQENIALLHGSFENVGRQVQMAQANYNAGLAPQLTVLQAQVARENLRPTMDQAENGLKLLMAQFAMYLGMDYNTPFELIPVNEGFDFIPFDVSEMIKKASQDKPDIRELRQNILMLQSARKAQIYALTPTLALSWNSNSVFIKNPWKDSWFDNKDDWNKSGSFSISLAFRLHSLIPWSADFQGIKNMDNQINTATNGLTQMIRGTEIEIYNTVLALEKTRTSSEALAQTVSLAEQSYKLTEQAYRAGLQDYFQVQSAELSLRQARVQMLEQQFNYLNGLIDLEYSIGVPFGTLNSNGIGSKEN